MLKINNLHNKVETQDGEEKAILKGLSLEVPAGEVHAIMGPNGSGKSTLSYVLTGRDGYEVTDGEMAFLGEELGELEPEERAAKGLYLSSIRLRSRACRPLLSSRKRSTPSARRVAKRRCRRRTS